MASCLLLLALFVFILNPHRAESLNLSEDEDLELEKQLRVLNKPAIKTINSDNGDVYDCVDFYKQPAFDHPLLKNFTFEKSRLLQIQRRGKLSSDVTHGLELEGEGCPLGTVPIKRITKEDLVREKLATEAIRSMAGPYPINGRRRPDIPPEIFKKYAIARSSISGTRYSGMQANISIHNPQCVESQYSAARMKMSNGPDSIEAGWRVDPYTFGDSLTRFYIRTDAGLTHCYNTRCPGFVVTATHIPLEKVATKISKLGGPVYEIFVSILRAEDGGYILQVGPNADPIGFWPSKIFTSEGLTRLASSLSWGGEVFSPAGSPKPPMGAGGIIKRDTDFSAYFSCILERKNRGYTESARDTLPFANSKHYQVDDVGATGTPAGHLVLYGGPGGSTD